MRTATSVTLAVLLAGACADPSAPVTPAPADAPPSLAAASLLPGRLARLSNLVDGTFVESFDLYKPLSAAPGDTIWRAGPVLWMPADVRGPAYPTPRVIDPSFVSPTYDRQLLANWAIVRHTRNPAFWRTIEGPFNAWHHPTTCDAPPLEHAITSYDESVFFCRNHMMTATNASEYGVTYLTPDRLVDLSTGTATVRFDVATLRTTRNDWIDLWVTPYDYNLVAPLDQELRSVDLQGQPRYGFHVRMTADDRNVSAFRAYVINDHESYPLPVATADGYETRFPQSATVRRRFELQVTPTRIRFGMPNEDLWWVDSPLPVPLSSLGIRHAVVQIGHHSMNPAADPGGKPTTWHWDNIGISPAAPFTIINPDRRYADAASPAMTLRSPAPAGARLRFAGHGSNLQVSYDGGRSWTSARRQQEAQNFSNRFHSYWMPIPAGVTSLQFRGSAASGFSGWFVRDVSVWLDPDA